MTLDADFWWLSPATDPDSMLVGVGHTEPLRDDDELGPMIRPLSATATELLRPLSGLRQWCAAWSDVNVYRTLWLFDNEGRPALVGPFYLDLDADDGPDGTPDLAAAAVDARRCVELLHAKGAEERDVKVWFTGHKGFNVEVRLEAVGVVDGASWARKHAELLEGLRRSGLPSDVVRDRNFISPNVRLDNIFSRFRPHLLNHRYLRLAGSKNVWLAADGGMRWRTKREIAVERLFARSGPEIASEVGAAET